MPTPPSYTRTTAFIGKRSGGFGGTWGALRSIIFNGTLAGSGVVVYGSHNIEYEHGFKTTDGNGLIRTDYSALYFNGGVPISGPNFTASGISPSPARGRFESSYSFHGAGSSSGMIVAEDRAQLIGQTAVLSSGSITISSDAFVGPYYQVYSAYNSSEVITSIGKLTAF